VLTLNDFRELCELYPLVYEKIKEKVEERKKFNQQKANRKVDENKDKNKESQKTDSPESKDIKIDISLKMLKVGSNNNIPSLANEDHNTRKDNVTSITDQLAGELDDIAKDNDDLENRIPTKTNTESASQLKSGKTSQKIHKAHTVHKASLSSVDSSPKMSCGVLNPKLLKIHSYHDSRDTEQFTKTRGGLNETTPDQDKKNDTSLITEAAGGDQSFIKLLNQTTPEEPEATQPPVDDRIRDQSTFESKGSFQRRTKVKLPLRKMLTSNLGTIYGGLGLNILANMKKKPNWKYKLFKNIHEFFLWLITIYVIVFMPLELAYRQIKYEGIIIVIEIITMLVYLTQFILDVRVRFFISKATVYDLNQQAVAVEQKKCLFTLFMEFIMIIPFSMIFENLDSEQKYENAGLIILQLTRLYNCQHVFWIFRLNYFQRMRGFVNIIISLLAFFLLNHIAACLMIVLGNTVDDFNKTWQRKIPAPQFNYPDNARPSDTPPADAETIYVSALYYSHVTTGHVGVGDVNGVNTNEKIYTVFLVQITVIVSAFIFGNFASFVEDIVPKYRRVYESNYRRVLQFLKANGLGKYVDKIHVKN